MYHLHIVYIILTVGMSWKYFSNELATIYFIMPNIINLMIMLQWEYYYQWELARGQWEIAYREIGQSS